MNMKKFLIPLLSFGGIFVICLFALLPLFHAGYFVMHDDEQIARLQQMYLVLSQGQIPPRWIPDLGFGFGYPLFNFYPPLVYYLGSVFHAVGFSFINATKLVMGLGFFLSAVAMFVWSRKHFGIIPAFFSALLYTYAPYHSVDLYVRGALSEFFSWIFIPLILWATDNLFEKSEKKNIILLASFLGLLMLSHTLVMLQFAPFFVFYIAMRFIFKKENRMGSVLPVFFAIALGFGLTAYFWIPSLLEKQYTLVDVILTKELASYAIHFVCPIQLWSGPWGYAGSVAGCVDGLSFQIGKIQAIIGIVGVIFSIPFMFKKKKRVSFIVSVIFLCSIFFSLQYSKFIWDFVKPFWYIQFPWRFLLFVALGSSFLGGFVLYVVEKRFGKYIALGFGIILSLLVVYQVRNYFQPQSYRMVDDAQLTSQEDIQWRVSSMSYEYVPKEVATQLSSQKTTELAIDHNQVPVLKSFTPLTNNMQVKELENISQLKKYRVNVYNTKTQRNGVLQINTYFFPGWDVTVDGKEVTSFVKNKLDLIQIEIPNGLHTVVVRFVNTPVRTIANTISLVSVIGLLVIIFWRKKYIYETS